MDTYSDCLIVEETSPTAVITMNRPEQRNALSRELMREMKRALDHHSSRPECRVIIIRGAGPAFCSGHDLQEMLGGAIEEQREIFRLCNEMMETIQHVPQPVIASVHGTATAAGCQLVATCDLAVASENARFATSGIKIGLFCSTPQVALSRNIGRKRALEMLLTGRMIDARTAAEWGLINRVVAPDRLEDEVLALAGEIAGASPLAIGTGKHSFYEQIEKEQKVAYALMGETMATSAVTTDAQAGMSAFLGKLPARARGR